ncbi:histone H4 transcription factor-like [Cylas formicarius]|uniref:histone H4 transcription factor-like n=1 Tax=Cylas formicarius TaxID=197179 RepID=UPI00295874FD|nr:histone H4 transcription factor-like [Cylas formicarius]
MVDFEQDNEGQGRLAVFEHVTKNKRPVKRKVPSRYSDDSSQSESELVIDDDAIIVPKKKKMSINFSKEVLNLHCGWSSCEKIFNNMKYFNDHVIKHIANKNYDCEWADCPNPTNLGSKALLNKHLSYHCYLTKLINIGENVLKCTKLPECHLEKSYSILINLNGYKCEWDSCLVTLKTINDFLTHVSCHVQGMPSGKESNNPITIPCEWSGCSGKFSTRYKLAEHVRVHTKERMLACPKCLALFSTKVTFQDHRRRQLISNLRRFQCSQCLKLFPSERILSDHWRSHINHYKCRLCDMTSSKPSILAKHYRYKHIKQRFFKCQECGKRFVAKCNLDTHLLSHKEKPMKCDLCNFGCKSKQGLDNHYVKVHNKPRTKYQCHVCQKIFQRGGYLTSHLMKMHEFHWPSGHSRFRYLKGPDGICRLQTVRYESLEVTEEMIKSEKQKVGTPEVAPDDTENDTEGQNLRVSETQSNNMENNGKVMKHEILMTVEDLDEQDSLLIFELFCNFTKSGTEKRMLSLKEKMEVVKVLDKESVSVRHLVILGKRKQLK